MLVLSRSRDEKVVILTGDATVTVQVVSVGSRCARLGFDAPESIVAYREPVYHWVRAAALAGRPPALHAKDKADGKLVLGVGEDERVMLVDTSDADAWRKLPLAMVRLTAVKGSHVQLGFTADRSVAIHRQEVADEIRRPSCPST